jgi:hypothetical protein
MNIRLACSRVLILLVLAPSLLGEARRPSEGVRAEWSRPLLEMRDIVGVVTFTDRVDVYWLHTNELIQPVRSTLYRSSVSADGSMRLGTTRIHAFEEQVSARVSGVGANVQVLWSERTGIYVSPVAGDTLKYPLGKRIASGLYPVFRCHATECAAVYDASSTQMAAVIDRDGNLVSGPFALPHGFHPLQMLFDERGIFFVRHDLSQMRAALVRRDGSVHFDVRIAAANPRAFHATHPAVTTTGADYVVAFVEFGTAPDELQVVTVGSNGSVSAPRRLMQLEEHRDLPNNFGGAALASSGSRFLLGGTYVIGTPFLATLDASLQLTGPVLRTDAIPSVHPHPDGSSFVLVWSAQSPYVTILRADGSMTAPVSLMPLPRRRATR